MASTDHTCKQTPLKLMRDCVMQTDASETCFCICLNMSPVKDINYMDSQVSIDLWILNLNNTLIFK
jgi:hypothetical protein